ncbi:MAG: hypothetical protein VXA12_07265, partial [Gammaproteobacteria bacterium]
PNIVFCAMKADRVTAKSLTPSIDSMGKLRRLKIGYWRSIAQRSRNFFKSELFGTMLPFWFCSD